MCIRDRTAVFPCSGSESLPLAGKRGPREIVVDAIRPLGDEGVLAAAPIHLGELRHRRRGIGGARLGERLRVADYGVDWTCVVTPDGKRGYMMTSYLEFE